MSEKKFVYVGDSCNPGSKARVAYTSHLLGCETYVNAEYVEKLEFALKTIAKGCPTKFKGCTCLENTAHIAIGERMAINDHG